MNPTVFYVEKEHIPELHEHILKHLPRMQHWYEWQGCELVYLPLHQLANAEWNSIHDYLIYQYPVLNQPEFERVLNTLQEPAHMLVNRMLVETNLQESNGKAFLLYTDKVSQKNGFQYKILSTYNSGVPVEQFFKDGFTELWRLRDKYNPSVCYLAYSTIGNIIDDIDSEDTHQSLVCDSEKFEEDEPIPILSGEIKTQLDQLIEQADKSSIIGLVVHLLNNLNPYLSATPASVVKMLEKHWSQYAVAGKSSRIFINKHTKIFISDFGNMEIEMSPLPKTLFLFYLRHPEGVKFKLLSEHKDELKQIYSKISNVSNPQKIQESIDALVDLRENSVNEKCSRIKEAFIKKMDISIADPYLIKGPRGGLKVISLDRSLVTYELPTLQACKD